jgi:hypothetical protein
VAAVGGHTARDSSGLEEIGLGLVGVAFAVVGGVLTARVRGNAIGPIFLAAGFALSLAMFCYAYADYALFVASPHLPGGRLSVLVWDVAGPPTFGWVGAALLLFPDGRLPSRRWRPALGLAIAGMALVVIGYLFRPGGGDEPYESVTNPLGIESLRVQMEALTALGWIFMGTSVLLGMVAMVRRLRRAHGYERQQLKWIGLAATILGAVVVADVISYFAGMDGDTANALRDLGLALGLLTLPVAAGFAILRYRLFDVDVVINRTLVYGLLTATLAVAYLGSVLLLQAALGPVTSGSSLAVAVSTLGVAALFRPARARIQAAVDRRFYRRRYDARQTLEDFSARLREQVDLDALGGELRGVVRDTMQPAHVSLWLRKAER